MRVGFEGKRLQVIPWPVRAQPFAANLVTVLDVRHEDDFAQGLLPARNIPLSDLSRALCARGFNAARREDGFPERKASGFAVEMQACVSHNG